MADLNRPEFGEAWAHAGEKLPPPQAKMGLGWIQEMMPFQYENYLQARQDEAILYLLQKGVPEYSPTQEYIANKSVVVYQGGLYIATATTTGVAPTDTTKWKRTSPVLGVNGEVAISAGGTGATTAEQARTNLGVGAVGTFNFTGNNGIMVKTGALSVVPRMLTGTTGHITITNPDGVDGDPVINVGADVVRTTADPSFTSKGGIKLPSGSTSERGSAVAGRIRFNNTTGKFEGYNGTIWEDLGSTGSSIAVQEFATDGVQTTYPLLTIPVSRNNILVTINGVVQHKSTYTITDTSIVFSEAPTSGFAEVVPMAAAPYSTGGTYVPPIIPDATEATLVDTLNAVLSALRSAGITQ